MGTGTSLNKLGDAVKDTADKIGASAGNVLKGGKPQEMLYTPGRGVVGTVTHGIGEGASLVGKGLAGGAKIGFSVIGFPFKVAGSLMGSLGGSAMKGSAKSALWVAERPVVGALALVRGGVNAVGNVFAHSPRLAWGATAVAAAAGVGSMLSKGAEARSSNYYQAQAAAMQAQPSFMNSVSPEETARLDASLKQNGQGGASFADATQRSEPTVKAL